MRSSQSWPRSKQESDRCRTSQSPATVRTPAIDFDFGNNHLKLSGESYPEDVTEFYNPIFSALDAYLATLGSGSCRFDFELIYVLMLMDKLDAAAGALRCSSLRRA
jgi:SiaC family regulatory phosphoprotein